MPGGYVLGSLKSKPVPWSWRISLAFSANTTCIWYTLLLSLSVLQFLVPSLILVLHIQATTTTQRRATGVIKSTLQSTSCLRNAVQAIPELQGSKSCYELQNSVFVITQVRAEPDEVQARISEQVVSIMEYVKSISRDVEQPYQDLRKK